MTRYSLLRTAHISDEMWASGLMDTRAKIVAGEIEVPAIWEATDVRAMMSSVDGV